MRSQQALASWAGLAAIVLWSTTIAFSRVVGESLGGLLTAAGTFGLGGLAGCLLALVRPSLGAGMRRDGLGPLLLCGALMAAYTMCLYLAIAKASDRRQVLEVGVINYLWPSLTLLLSVPILRRRARAALPAGLAVAFAGIVVAVWPAGHRSLGALLAALRAGAGPYALALAAAVAWALYSNLTRRWPATARPAAVSLFMLASGLACAALALTGPPPRTWHAGLLLPLAYLALLPGLAAYSLWALAMQKGNATLVASAAQLTPLLSTLLSCAVLRVLPPGSFWLGCAMVVAGAVIGARGIRR